MAHVLIPKRNIALKENVPRNFKIVPRNQDPQNRDSNQQIRDLRGQNLDSNDTIIVDPNAVNESGDGGVQFQNPYIQAFSLIPHDTTSSVPRRRVERLVADNVPFHGGFRELIELLRQPEFNNQTVLDYIVSSLKYIFKQNPSISAARPNQDFLTNDQDKVDFDKFKGSLATVFDSPKLFKKIETYFREQSRYIDGEKVASNQELAGVGDVVDAEAENTLNNLLGAEIDRLAGGGDVKQTTTDAIIRNLASNKEYARGAAGKNPAGAAYVKLQKKIDDPRTSDSEKERARVDLEKLRQVGFETDKTEIEGQDRVDANLLLQYAAFANDFKLVDKAFSLKNREVEDRQGREGGRFTRKMSKMLHANQNISDEMKQYLNKMGLSENKTIILTDKQVEMLKERIVKHREILGESQQNNKTNYISLKKKDIVENVIKTGSALGGLVLREDKSFRYKGYIALYNKDGGYFSVYKPSWSTDTPIFDEIGDVDGVKVAILNDIDDDKRKGQPTPEKTRFTYRGVNVRWSNKQGEWIVGGYDTSDTPEGAKEMIDTWLEGGLVESKIKIKPKLNEYWGDRDYSMSLTGEDVDGFEDDPANEIDIDNFHYFLDIHYPHAYNALLNDYSSVDEILDWVDWMYRNEKGIPYDPKIDYRKKGGLVESKIKIKPKLNENIGAQSYTFNVTFKNGKHAGKTVQRDAYGRNENEAKKWLQDKIEGTHFPSWFNIH